MKTPGFFAQTPADGEASGALSLPADAFSDVLELMRVRGNTVFTCAVDDGAGITFPHGRPRLHIVMQGSVVVAAGDGAETLTAAAGDLVLLVHGYAHSVLGAPDAASVPLESLVEHAFDTRRRMLGNGSTQWLSGEFTFDDALAKRLLSDLPRTIVLRGLRDRPAEWLDLCTRFILDEALKQQAGAAAMISRLLDLLLVQILRTWAAQGAADRGWLLGALDPSVAKALAAMHADPARTWRVHDFAGLTALSKSAFANRFQRVVGQAPLNYLAAWRLDRAAELLRHSSATVSEICATVGYGSEAAFSRAFRSRFSVTPSQWRKELVAGAGCQRDSSGDTTAFG